MKIIKEDNDPVIAEYYKCFKPIRDQKANLEAFLKHNAKDNPELYDINFLAEEVISKNNNDLCSLETQLWKYLLTCCKLDQAKDIVKKFFMVSEQFIRTVRELDLPEDFININYVKEPLNLSFTVPKQIQNEIVKKIKEQSIKNISSVDFNRSKASFVYWSKLVQIILDPSDRFGLAKIRTGLSQSLIDLCKNLGYSVFIPNVIDLNPDFCFKLRCSEEIVLNILTETNIDNINQLRIAKYLQCISSNIGGNFSDINKKLEELEIMLSKEN